jgi:hypothetical protein
MTVNRLPHKAPLIFITGLTHQTDAVSTFGVSFPLIPTLAMFCEAASQGTSYFPLSHECNIGVVSSFRRVRLLQKPTTTTAQISLTIQYQMGNSYIFSFIASNYGVDIAIGEMVIFYLVA